ncbi:FUSC family protein [Streptomyces sp. AM8-1-1]|uniref:FUSC family protein n=1 Tax=Streptomyces sp. AM8-1-1 TaxID=3075825 RepID=UPI0028C4504E|nr:FUSC family protein [Streptomyces sp. AM8-1-1]WNO70777.1 FUSC family protein [Streptomyces sp. AM8-1-1]
MRVPKADRTTIVHRAVRVSVASCAGFYPFVYAVDRPAVALYALFAPVALGMLSPIPGSGRVRAGVILRALPVGLVLVALGTVLAVETWAAVAGMLVVGFLLAFAAVGGPLPAGAAPGLQLFYILACFPPYAPGALGQRLAGLTLGVLLLAACEVLLLPAPATVSYRELLADAVALAGRAAATADSPSERQQAADETPAVQPPVADDRPVAQPPVADDTSAERLREFGGRLRLSRLPTAERPAGAGRRDRALAQASGAARRLLVQLARLRDAPASVDAASAAMLDRVAALCATAATALRGGQPMPAYGMMGLGAAIDEFQAVRTAQTTNPSEAAPPLQVLRRQAAVLAIAESARILETSVRIGLDGRRTPGVQPQELFWYAGLTSARLWWRRVAGNTTLRSVQFQNAVRIALGLGAARLVAGSLDLTHGFWVLLAVLTLGRTTATETWSAVRSALIGTLVGATAAGALLLAVGHHTDAYAVVLAPAMLAAFALGPMLGVAWAQALFTLVVSAAFAQIAHVSWQLAEVRLIDVVTGSVIGLLCGLLAWPAGARREVHRNMAALLRASGPLIPATVRVLLPAGPEPQPTTLPALHRLRLAEAAYLQFESEPGQRPADATDWHAVLITANDILLGVQLLPRFDPPPAAGRPDDVAWARAGADRLELATDRIAALCAGEGPPPSEGPPTGLSLGPRHGRPLPLLMDLEHWLRVLAAELAHIEKSVTARVD